MRTYEKRCEGGDAVIKGTFFFRTVAARRGEGGRSFGVRSWLRTKQKENQEIPATRADIEAPRKEVNCMVVIKKNCYWRPEIGMRKAFGLGQRCEHEVRQASLKKSNMQEDQGSGLERKNI